MLSLLELCLLQGVIQYVQCAFYMYAFSIHMYVHVHISMDYRGNVCVCVCVCVCARIHVCTQYNHDTAGICTLWDANRERNL